MIDKQTIKNMTDLKIEKKTTPLGNSYWNDSGAYQSEYDALYKQLVPDSGEAETLHGELIRGASRLTYDYYNNGNCNVTVEEFETCPNCGGDGEIYDEDDYEVCWDCDGEGEISLGLDINEYYDEMLTLIKKWVPTAPTEKLERFLYETPYGETKFTPEEEKPYTEMMDAIMHFVLTTENQKL